MAEIGTHTLVARLARLGHHHDAAHAAARAPALVGPRGAPPEPEPAEKPGEGRTGRHG